MMNKRLPYGAVAEGWVEVEKWIFEGHKEMDNIPEQLYLPYLDVLVDSADIHIRDEFKVTGRLEEADIRYIYKDMSSISYVCFVMGYLFHDRRADFERLFDRLRAKYGLVEEEGMKDLWNTIENWLKQQHKDQ